MLVTLTAKSAQDGDRENDPIAMFLACHRRIRDHLALAKRVVDAIEPTSEEVAEAAASLIRYFGQALPLHILDEDETLHDALRGRELAPDVVRAMATMTAEHAVIEPAIHEALDRWRQLTDQPLLLSTLREELSRLTLLLSTLRAAHLEAEERLIFPAVAKALTVAEQAELARRMRQRRQVGAS